MSDQASHSTKVTWTYDDLRGFPSDGNRYEVMDGDLFVTPAPSTKHQRVSGRLYYELVTQLDRTGLAIVFAAPCDVIVSPTRAVEPDVLVVLAARRGIISERGIEGAPDLIAEILSPDEAQDRDIKRKLYASMGVPEYWIVDPRRHAVLVLTLDGGDYRVAGSYGPGQHARAVTLPFEIAVDELFAP